MAYVVLATTDRDADSPVTVTMIDALYNNPTAIANGDAGAPQVQTAAIADAAITVPKTEDFASGTQGANTMLISGTRISTSWGKIGGDIYIPRAGVIKTRIGVSSTYAGSNGYGRVYVNGVAVGTTRTVFGTTRTTFDENIAVAVGDLVQIYGTGFSTYGVNVDIAIGTSNRLEESI